MELRQRGSRRTTYVAFTVLVICCGLALRKFGYDLHLPFVVVKFGGSGLWGAMVYLLLASMTGKSEPGKTAVSAFLIAITVELFRLYHTQWLDAFRLTTAGALLLGRVFSPWNILAYGIGIVAALLLDCLWLSKARKSP
ncbi:MULTISPECIES: DUF2809 domain-containing protein [unclassified Sinorhizobium]|uniref:ribosomal maturation YjgA family protein n=1 Tax=unclassified Sinorhizobium TaxID=2613772 RepID=UPI003523A7B3